MVRCNQQTSYVSNALVHTTLYIVYLLGTQIFQSICAPHVYLAVARRTLHLNNITQSANACSIDSVIDFSRSQAELSATTFLLPVVLQAGQCDLDFFTVQLRNSEEAKSLALLSPPRCPLCPYSIKGSQSPMHVETLVCVCTFTECPDASNKNDAQSCLRFCRMDLAMTYSDPR